MSVICIESFKGVSVVIFIDGNGCHALRFANTMLKFNIYQIGSCSGPNQIVQNQNQIKSERQQEQLN